MTSKPSPVRIGVVLVWSAAAWVALWSEFSLANVIWGLVVGCLVVLVVPLRASPRTVTVRPLALLWLVTYVAWGLAKASAIVAWEVVTPGSQIHEGIVAAPLRTTSRGVITLIANVISLTPGTVTLEVHEEPPTLYVHVLHLRTLDEARSEIRHLEDLAIRAFPGIARPLVERP